MRGEHHQVGRHSAPDEGSNPAIVKTVCMEPQRLRKGSFLDFFKKSAISPIGLKIGDFRPKRTFFGPESDREPESFLYHS